ncbi:MAG: glycosyltransferase family 2 protein, partial [Mariprofundales bacterium]
MNTPTVAIIVPCYNEEDALPETHQVIGSLLARLKNNHAITEQSFVCYVDDGSNDNTWKLIRGYTDEKKFNVNGIRLSRNFGHQHALLAGMMATRKYVDCTITIDADLQQDLDAIDAFLVHYHRGKDIVYGVRNNRNADGWFKNVSARGFYRLMSLMGVNLLANHADYRLLSRRAMDALSTYGEHHLFLRALVKELGFEEAIVYFDVHERKAGASKYSLRKMVMLALDGITSFSVVPLRIIAVFGLLFTVFA